MNFLTTKYPFFMRLQDIAAFEQKFKTGNAGTYVLKPFEIPVVGDEPSVLKGMDCVPADGFTGYFREEKFKKERIVLHYTVGNIAGDIASLTSRKRGLVSVPFVIARDGTVYRLHNPSFWSNHLGLKGVGNAENDQDKMTIGIELSNYGPLVPILGNMETIYSRQVDGTTGVTRVDVYCGQGERDAFVKSGGEYRGYQYFATFTNAQYNSTVLLLRYLTQKYGISRSFLPENLRYDIYNDVINFNGIVSHVNYRADKNDVGATFDWNRVITGVKARKFAPMPDRLGLLGGGVRGILDAEMPINTERVSEKIFVSEEELDAAKPVKTPKKTRKKKGAADLEALHGGLLI
jgi:N-acetyl-anhydromuramyl-L-alanine amidase AmpD